jgi:phage/plasmid-like protein (TIGR03299 family)
MAHNIEEYEDRGSFVTAGGRKNIPWHGLGEIFENEKLTIEEAIVACRANYEVEKNPLVRITQEDVENILAGKPITRLLNESDIIKSHQCTYRNDRQNVLGVVGSGYEVVQNLTGFEFVNNILNGVNGTFDKPFIETAGVLGNGERIFVTAKFDKPIKIKGSDDIIDDYILFTNSHDGTGAVIAQFCTTRVVCNNTLNIALHESRNKIYFKHTKNVHGKIDLKSGENMNMALSILRGHTVYIHKLEESLNRLADINVNNNYVQDVIANTFMTPEQVSDYIKNNRILTDLESVSQQTKNEIYKVTQTVDEGVGQDKWRGTGLWLLNGITSYYQNEKKYKDDTYKLDSVMDGYVFKKIQKAYDMIAKAA